MNTLQSHPQDLSNHRDYLLGLLKALDGVTQSAKYHPESDALYHSLQVFEHAYRNSQDPLLWLAALLHDVGKSIDSKTHCDVGANMLEGICPNSVVYLVKHHLDLAHSPCKTKQRLAGTNQLTNLQQLRRWDIAGRDPHAWVRTPEQALDITLHKLSTICA